ncbi:MAG TPA: M36 family metallopeptidase [Vicinamibacterales bacterium]|jgi:M6 family metalloprotease-like protein
MNKRSIVLAVLVCALAGHMLAQPQYSARDQRQASFERRQGRGWVMRWSPERDRVITLLGRTAKSYRGKPADAAREFLRENADLFGLRSDLADLTVLVEQSHLGGASVEFQQVYQGRPVENGRLQVNLDKENRVLMVASSYLPQPAPPAPPRLSREQAVEQALAEFMKRTPRTQDNRMQDAPPQVAEVYFARGRELVPAFKIHIERANPFGVKEFIIHAVTGEVLFLRDFVHDADGTGRVFDPNPRGSRNDNTITEATLPTDNPNPYYDRPLLNLDPASGGEFHLQGPFVSVEDFVGPSNTVATEAAASDFTYSRGGTDFTDVMAYYHIDTIQRYIQSLGFVNVNNRRIRIDSHGESGQNAHSVNTPAGAGYLKFGDVGTPITRYVAEDADIIFHEYGHAVQANVGVTKFDGNSGDNSTWALGEGFGDYLGASATFDAITAAGGDTALVGEWAWFGGLRRVDTGMDMDDFVPGGEEHNNGQIWSQTLWNIFGAIGKVNADRVILQSHFNVPDSPKFKDNADAIMTADMQLYAGSHLAQLCEVFKDQKIYVDADCPMLPQSTGPQQTMVVLAHFNESTLPLTPISFADVTTRINDTGTYLSEISYNGANLVGTTPLGWIDLPGTRASYYDQTSGNMLIDLVDDVIAALPGTTFSTADRLIIITNDDGSGGETRGAQEWATTGPWPYALPVGFGKKRMSVSVHRYDQTQAQFNHAIGHHFGLIDLYPHQGVTFPRRYANGWSNMAQNSAATAFPNTHVFAWEKNRPPWTDRASTPANNVRFIPYPGAGNTFEETIPIFTQETNSAGNPIAIQIGTTPGATVANEKVSYWIEARRKSGTFDSNIPAPGVLVYYVNEWIGQGFGPARIVDATPNDNDLTNAALSPPGGNTIINNVDGTGLTVEALVPTGGEDFRVRVKYTPSPSNDVWINPQDGYWQSPDIWVDNDDCHDGNCGFDELATPPRTPMDRGDHPIAERNNRVYARVYNHGPGTAHNVRVDFYFSDPYHAADGGSVDPDTGGNIAFNEHKFVEIADLPPTDAGVPVFVEWTPDPVANPDAVHSCIKVKIAQVTNDSNAYNQASQENIQQYDIASHSPYPPVVDPFKVVNPYDHGMMVFLRADNVPEGWTAEVSPKKAWVPVGGSVDAVMTIQAPLTYPVCSSERVTATAWYASGDTLVPLGGTTADVHLTQSTEVTSTSEVKCSRALKHSVNAQGGQCAIVTKGCTNPKRPNEHITIRYTAPDGTTVLHDVLTDANGCFEDFFVTPGAGPWTVDTKYQGGNCTQPSRDKPHDVFVPPSGGLLPAGKLLYSFHLGMSFPAGTFNDHYDPGPSVTIDVESRSNDRLSLLAFAGYHQFDGDGTPDNLGVLNLNFNLKQYFPIGTLTGFAEVGPGWYRASGSSHVGANAGAGLHFDVLPKLAIETSTDLHYVKAKPRMMFFDARLGVVWRF